MRILWLSHFVPYPPRGGALQRSHHLLRQAARRHEVHLVAMNQRALLPTPQSVAEAVAALSPLCSRVDVFPNLFDASRVRWAAMAAAGIWRRRPYDVRWLWQPSLSRFLADLADGAPFDVVHVDTVGLMPHAAAFGDLPLVLNHHNIESQMLHRRAERDPGVMRRLYCRREAAKLQRYEREACRRAAVNITVSALDAERLLALVPGVRARVVENGVDIEYFHPARTRGRAGSLVFAGTMNWYPNQEAMRFFLREVWPLLLAENPERHLTVIGREPPAEVLVATRQGRVSAPGFVEDVRPYLAEAAIYVCPIRDGGGTRLKVLDALAMQKPLVATGLAVEGLELVKDEHYLRAESPADFVRQIRRLEESPELCERLGANGRRLVEARYAWDEIGRRLEQAYATARATSSTDGRQLRNSRSSVHNALSRAP